MNFRIKSTLIALGALCLAARALAVPQVQVTGLDIENSQRFYGVNRGHNATAGVVPTYVFGFRADGVVTGDTWIIR
jgi:hypothetical protein